MFPQPQVKERPATNNGGAGVPVRWNQIGLPAAATRNLPLGVSAQITRLDLPATRRADEDEALGADGERGGLRSRRR